MPSSGTEGFVKRLIKSVWFFPVVLALVLIGLTALRISGTSVGIYHQAIYGSTKDPDLLLGHPQPIRSDEWLFVTQLTIAQARQGYPRFNHNIEDGKDMSLMAVVPYKDWSAVFHPENFAFFVAPLDYAFAFKWWFLLYMLVVSCYFFILKLFKSRRGLATLLATGVGLTPFVFWWYQLSTLGCLFYGFLILILGMRLIDDERFGWLGKRPNALLVSRLIHTAALTYVLVAFGLLLYPPFQIPVALVVAAFLLGYLLDKKAGGKTAWRQLLLKLWPLAAAAATAALILGSFLLTRQGVVHAVTNTVYPGNRLTISGHLNPLHVFDAFLMPQLESGFRASHFFTNQSEASNFILLAPFLVLPSLLIIGRDWFKRRTDWTFTLVNLAILLFLARMFLPFGDPLYKLFMLHRVPNERLIIGLGFAGVLQLLLLLKRISLSKVSNRRLIAAALLYSVACFLVLLAIGFHTSHLYPLFIHYPFKIVLLAGGFAAIIFLVLARQPVLAAALFALFSLGCVIRIHPLYRGLGWIENNSVYSAMQAVSAPGSHWVTADNIILENMGSLANRDNISGIQPYPNLAFWRQIQGPGADYIYNRYAHVLFNSDPTFKDKLKLIQSDSFQVQLGCGQFVKSEVDYVVANHSLNQTCLNQVKKIDYPGISFYLYQVVK